MRRAPMLAIAVFSIAVAPRLSHAQPSFGGVEAIVGYRTIDGRPARIEVLLARERSVDRQAVADRLLGALHASPTPSPDFAFLGAVWGQFFDQPRKNDLVSIEYNASGDPTGSGGLVALDNVIRTWSNVPGSSMRLAFGGLSARCPSLSFDCPGGTSDVDGHDDIGWRSISWDDPDVVLVLGYEVNVADAFTGIVIESDIVLNSDIAPFVWSTIATDDILTDVETVVLHEIGHLLGLGHSFEPSAVMFPFIFETRRALSVAETDALRELYPKQPPTVTDARSVKDLQLVAERGASAPGGGAYLDHFEPGAVNNHGDVVFVTDVEGGGQALFVARPGGVVQIARSGDLVAGWQLGFGSNNVVGINDAGDVAFSWFLGPPESPAALAGLFRADDQGHVEALVLPGAPAPGGGVFVQTIDAVLSNNGDIAFEGVVETGGTRARGLYVARQFGGIEVVAKPGDPAPGGGTFSAISVFSSISGKGHIAFTATTSAAASAGVYALRADTGRLEVVVRPGDAAPGGGTFANATRPRINDRGDVLFGGVVPRPGQALVNGLYLARSGGGIERIAAPGDVMPDGWTFTRLLLSFVTWTLNDKGDVAFAALTQAGPYSGVFPLPFSIFRQAIYASSNGQLREVIRQGDVIVGIGSIASAFPLDAAVLIDERGDIVFPVRTTAQRLVLIRAGRKT